MKHRVPIMPSKHFIKVYFASFAEDPILKNIKIDSLANKSKGFSRALSAFQRGEYDEIIGACTEEIDSSESEAPCQTKALVLRATFYSLIGKHEDAMSDFKAVIDNKDADVKLKVNALIKLSTLNMQLEKTDVSAQLFKDAIELDPDNCDIYHHRAQYNLLLGNIPSASADFTRAIELNPKYSGAYAQKCYTDYRDAMSNVDVEKLRTVMENFQKAIKKFPNCCECYSLYAQVLTDQQKFAEADEFFEKTLSKDPNNATVYVQRAVLNLQWTTDLTKSVDLIRKALEIDPKCEYAYEMLGSIEVQRSNFKEAIDLFEKAILLAKTENEMIHLYSLKDAALAQLSIANKMGIDYSSFLKMTS